MNDCPEYNHSSYLLVKPTREINKTLQIWNINNSSLTYFHQVEYSYQGQVSINIRNFLKLLTIRINLNTLIKYVPGNRINPPSNAKTKPAPLLDQTENFNLLSAANLSLVC